MADQNSTDKIGFVQTLSGRNIKGPQIADKIATGTIDNACMKIGESVRPENNRTLNALIENVTITITRTKLVILIINYPVDLLLSVFIFSKSRVRAIAVIAATIRPS